MRNIFLLIIFLFGIEGFGQVTLTGNAEYKLHIAGYIATCSNCCGDVYGLKNVSTKYANGSEISLFTGRKVNESIHFETTYTKNNPITQVNYGIVIRWETFAGCNGGPANRDKTYSLNSCSYIQNSTPGDGLSGVKIASRPSVTIIPSTEPLYLSDNKDLTITLPDNIDNSYYRWKYKVADGAVKDFPSPYNLKSTLKISGKDFLSDSDDNKTVYVWVEMNCDAGEKLGEALTPGPDYSGCAQAVWVPVLDPWGDDRGDGYWDGEDDIVCMNAANEINNRQKEEIIRQYQSRTSNIINFTYKLSCPTMTPINVTDIKCNGETGSVELAFDGELLDGKELSFTVHDSATNLPLANKIVSKSDIKNLKYLLTGLNSGAYYIIYQAQSIGPYPKNGSIPLKTPIFTVKSQPQLTFTAAATQPKCNTESGSILITAQGGTSPYKYSRVLNNNIIESNVVFNSSVITNALVTGSHTIYVSDAYNCVIAPQSIEINQAPPAIRISGTVINKTALGPDNGQIVLDAPLAGTPGYSTVCKKGTETINNLGTLSVGTYVITSNHLSCPNDSKTFQVREEISCNVTKTDEKCKGANDGAITLNIQGGSGNYAIEWKDSSNNIYSVSAPITSTSNGIYKYIATNLPPGQYTYTITDTETLPVTIISTPLKAYTNSETITTPSSLLSVQFYSKSQPTPSNPNGGAISIAVTNGYGNYKYFWTKDANPMAPNPNSSDINKLGDGTYVLTVIDNNGLGCTKSSVPVVLKTLSIKDISEKNINCYGDATGSIEVKAEGGTLDSNAAIKKYQYQWYESDNAQPTETFIELPNETNPILAGLKTGKYQVEIRDSYDSVLSHVYSLTQPNKSLTVISDKTTQQHHASCFEKADGAIEITVDGGTPNYTYAWSNDKTSQNISGIIPGTYSVLVTDAKNCKAEINNITINSPSEINIPERIVKKVSIFGKNLTDGAITIAPITGGLVENETSTTYDYSWTKDNDATVISTDLSINNLGKGTYHLTVKANNTNCTKTIDCIVSENDELTVDIQETQSIYCFGTPTGKLHADIKGGFGLYKIAWYKKNEQTSSQDFISNLQDIDQLTAGEYSVKVTDSANPEPNGPFAEAEQLDYKLINQKALLTVNATAQTNILCHGAQTGAISIQIEGGTAPYTAVWSNENTPLPARTNLGKSDTIPGLFSGTYSVVITDPHGCTASLLNPIVISQPTDPLLITDLEVKNLTGFETQNGSVKVEITGGTSPYKYSFGNQSNVSMIGNTLLLDKLSIGNYTLTITDANGCTTSNPYNLIQPDKLLITAISQNPTSIIKCHGDKFGILEATVTGGAPIGVLDANKNYTYKWYNVLTPNVTASTTNPSETLVAGTYALTVTDVENNTFTMQSAPIIEPPLLKITYTQTNVSCYDGNNGSIALTVTGGTGNHTINWSNGKNTTSINNLRAGVYTVTVTDDNQCQTIETITITEPGLLYVSKVTKTPPSALGGQDGSIKIQITGGTPNYNYLWYNSNKDLIYSDLNQPSNTSINNIFAGQYFITVTDAKGCSIIEKDLDKIDPLMLSINQINVVKCNGDATASIKAAASGGTPIYYYKWYKTTDPQNVIGQAATLENISAGTYFVVLSDSFGLTKQSDNITITQPDILNNTLASEYTRCGDANDWSITTAPTGGTTPYTYLWNTGTRTASLQDVPPADYSVLVTDSHGCTNTQKITITAPIHLATAETITKPTCFEGSDATIVLTSSGGQGPYTYSWNTGEQSNVLSNASAKVYSVAVTDFKGCVINKTYTIENPPKDVINLGEDVTLCFDQSLTINATIADDKAKYSWTSTKGFTSNKPIITVSEPAEYTLIVTNHLGCNATDTLKISKQDTAISAEFAVSSQVFVNEKFIIVDISNPIADSIEWILPAEATLVSKNKDFAELSFSKAGEYELTLNTKKGDCTATQSKKMVVVEGEYTDPDSTDLKKKFDLKIYPNPSNGVFAVDVTLDKVMPTHVKVYNLTNNMIIDSKYQEGKDQYTFNFSLNGLTAGVYFVLVESQQGSQLRKIIIN
ncbi:T9SS type A sorting domain-containing protein [Flavobacterium aestivum]|uniref:T9SS type A sorting domain-containing protein n=1 Tax=Flavobacterium aestivum TaxID=3003257 RepID=UPI002482DA8E|nr:T9SS type A sorting domain-containing protein [Flavobacterium aestivum]